MGIFAGMESGAIAAWVAVSFETAAAGFDSFVAQTACASDAGNGTLLLGCLLQLPAAEILKAQLSASATFAPTVDGVELLVHPTVAAAAGNFSNVVPILLGSNENDGSMWGLLAASSSLNSAPLLAITALTSVIASPV